MAAATCKVKVSKIDMINVTLSFGRSSRTENLKKISQQLIRVWTYVSFNSIQLQLYRKNLVWNVVELLSTDHHTHVQLKCNIGCTKIYTCFISNFNWLT